MTAFVEWRKDLEYRAERFRLERRPEPIQDPERRYGLSTDDYAYLGEIERPFEDKRKKA